jgi:hypothetical protein
MSRKAILTLIYRHKPEYYQIVTRCYGIVTSFDFQGEPNDFNHKIPAICFYLCVRFEVCYHYINVFGIVGSIIQQAVYSAGSAA